MVPYGKHVQFTDSAKQQLHYAVSSVSPKINEYVSIQKLNVTSLSDYFVKMFVSACFVTSTQFTRVYDLVLPYAEPHAQNLWAVLFQICLLSQVKKQRGLEICVTVMYFVNIDFFYVLYYFIDFIFIEVLEFT